MLSQTGTLDEGAHMTEPSRNRSNDEAVDTEETEGHIRAQADAEQAEGEDDVAGHMQPPPDLRRDR
jgi:hypothetical protein